MVVSLSTDRPVAYDDIEEHFKYGSIGSEPGVSLLQPVGGVLPPYWVFRALPAICRDSCRGGYASFGFIVEPGHELPIGVSRRRRVGHRPRRAELRRVPQRHGARHARRRRPASCSGMPAHQLDLQGFVQFVLECTLDSRLTPDAVRAQFPASRRAAVAVRARCCCGPGWSTG